MKRDPRTPHWIACFSDPSGRRFQRSTKLTNRKEALKVADAWEAAYRGKQTETQIREVMGEIFEEVHARPLAAYTLGQWADTWLGRVKPELRPKTHRRYSEVVATLKRMAPDLAATPLDRVSPDGVLAFRARLLEVRSPTTVNQSLKIWRSCLKAAWEAGVATDNPFARVKRVRGEPPVEKQPFTVEQIKVLLAAADDEWRGMILAGIYSGGQRLGDISTMEARQVDLKGGAVRFTTDKTGREVVIPLVPAWRADLAKRIKGKAPGALLFPRAGRLFRAADNRPCDVSKGFRRLLHKVGLAPKVGPRVGAVKGKRVALPYSFHSFRHTATSMLKNAGVSDSVTRDIVGHDSVAVSRVYTHIDDAAKRRALEGLPVV